MDVLDDPFSTEPIPEDIHDGLFDQFIQGLAEEDLPEGDLFADEPYPSIPIPLPPTADAVFPDAPVNYSEVPDVPFPLDEEQLPSTGASGASRNKTASKRTPKTTNDRLEKVRAKNRRGQAKYREKCKVRWPFMRLST